MRSLESLLCHSDHGRHRAYEDRSVNTGDAHRTIKSHSSSRTGEVRKTLIRNAAEWHRNREMIHMKRTVQYHAKAGRTSDSGWSGWWRVLVVGTLLRSESKLDPNRPLRDHQHYQWAYKTAWPSTVTPSSTVNLSCSSSVLGCESVLARLPMDDATRTFRWAGKIKILVIAYRTCEESIPELSVITR